MLNTKLQAAVARYPKAKLIELAKASVADEREEADAVMGAVLNRLEQIMPPAEFAPFIAEIEKIIDAA